MGFGKIKYDVEKKGLDPKIPHKILGKDGKLLSKKVDDKNTRKPIPENTKEENKKSSLENSNSDSISSVGMEVVGDVRSTDVITPLPAEAEESSQQNIVVDKPVSENQTELVINKPTKRKVAKRKTQKKKPVAKTKEPKKVRNKKTTKKVPQKNKKVAAKKIK